MTLLVLEIGLTLWAMPTYFPSEPPPDVVILPWRACDELGCHYQYESATAACAEGVLVGRRCILNRQGFSDTDDFVVQDGYDEHFRILIMGDSFTQGFSADIGKSFVETLEGALPDIVVWNTAISGQGTNQAVATFDAFAAQLQPQLSILGFYMNDFRDNLVPIDGWQYLQNVEGELFLVQRFQEDRWGNDVYLPADVENAYLAAGHNPPLNELERVVGLTRLGTLSLRLLDSMGSIYRGIDDPARRQKQLTRQYLIQLRDAASALDSQFLVLVIPSVDDIGDPGQNYQLALLIDAGIGRSIHGSDRHTRSRCGLRRAARWPLEQCGPPKSRRALDRMRQRIHCQRRSRELRTGGRAVMINFQSSC